MRQVLIAIALVLSGGVAARAQTFDQFYAAWLNGTLALPPQVPQVQGPVDQSQVATPTVTLTCTALGATMYDIAFGTVNPPPQVATQTACSWTSPTLIPGQIYFWQMVARNPPNTIASLPSALQRFTTPAIVVGLPAPWVTADVGSPALPGSATYAGATFTLQGAGTDIWFAADQFRFVYQPLLGDGTIVARVATLQPVDPWTKGGIMVREGLLADAPNVTLEVTPGNGIVLQSRAVRGGQSISTKVTGVAPQWLRLQRTGSSFTASYSANGTTWTTLGIRAITLTSQVLVGLSLTSHNPATLATATYDNVLVTPVGPPPPTGLIALAWDPSGTPTVTSYLASCGPSPGTYTVTQNAGLTLATSVTGLTLGTPYFCIVQALTAGEISGPSNEVSGLPR